jgi:short-subunit dehydrogenase
MRVKLKPLEEQVIVITGASSGIGLATVENALTRGARLVLVSRSADTLEDIVDYINANGGAAIHVACDVGDREQLEAVAEAAIEHFGRIDTWINNAGVGIYGRLEAVSEADNRQLFETNFWGVVNGSLIALPYLRAHGGALINVGSEVSDTHIPLQGMYTASKHAVKGFTDALRIEVEEIDKAPVSIVLIQPTAVNTPYPQHAKNYLDREPRLPNPRIDPHDVADAILDAACEGGRDVKVGASAHVSTVVYKFMPGLADKISARLAKQQQLDRPPLRNPDGALYRPSGGGHIYGHDPAAH